MFRLGTDHCLNQPFQIIQKCIQKFPEADTTNKTASSFSTFESILFLYLPFPPYNFQRNTNFSPMSSGFSIFSLPWEAYQEEPVHHIRLSAWQYYVHPALCPCSGGRLHSRPSQCLSVVHTKSYPFPHFLLLFSFPGGGIDVPPRKL